MILFRLTSKTKGQPISFRGSYGRSIMMCGRPKKKRRSKGWTGNALNEIENGQNRASERATNNIDIAAALYVPQYNRYLRRDNIDRPLGIRGKDRRDAGDGGGLVPLFLYVYETNSSSPFHVPSLPFRPLSISLRSTDVL